MEFLKRHWKSRTLILIVFGTVVSLLMWSLELTQWAQSMNTPPAVAEDGQRPPPALMIILPLVKVLLMLAVPASLVIGIRALFRVLLKKTKPRTR